MTGEVEGQRDRSVKLYCIFIPISIGNKVLGKHFNLVFYPPSSPCPPPSCSSLPPSLSTLSAYYCRFLYYFYSTSRIGRPKSPLLATDDDAAVWWEGLGVRLGLPGCFDESVKVKHVSNFRSFHTAEQTNIGRTTQESAIMTRRKEEDRQPV